jgi:hypothetical protein
MHYGGVASVYDRNCAGDVPLKNVPNVGCLRSEPAGEVKRVVGKPYTSQMVVWFIWFVLFIWFNQTNQIC